MLFFLLACGVAEMTVGPEYSGVVDSGTIITDTNTGTVPVDTGTEPTTPVSDPNPNEDGNVFIQIRMGRAEPAIAFWYGYCGDGRTAENCTGWELVGTVANQTTFSFDYLATSGVIVFDAEIDSDGDGESDKDVAEEDDLGCYLTGSVVAQIDGADVSADVELVYGAQGCVLGLVL